MNTEGLVRNARVLLRAEKLAGEIQLRHLIVRSGLQFVAGLIGVFGVVMLGVAVFLALEDVVGDVYAALIVGFGAIVVAGVVLLVAARVVPGQDLELAHALRDQAGEALLANVRDMEHNVLGIARMVRSPLDGSLTGLLVPLIGFLLKSLRRSPKAED